MIGFAFSSLEINLQTREQLVSPSLPPSECSGDGQGMSSASVALVLNPQKPNWTSPESGTSVSSKPAGDPIIKSAVLGV